MVRILFGFLLFLGFGGIAHAEWRVAESEHFEVYADDSEEDIRHFARQLETFHAALEIIMQADLPAPSPSNRVTIYAVGGDADVRRLFGERSSMVAGFYIPRAGSSVAFVPDVRISNGELNFSTVVLLHEYVHHFMMSVSRLPVPRWLGEGAAEFFASARFEDDGGISIGRLAKYRVNELEFARQVTARELLDPDRYEEVHGDDLDSFYGRAWLLYHYLTFDEARRGQLATYIGLMAGGKTSREAAEEAFGDLRKLDRDNMAYIRNRALPTFQLPGAMLDVGQVSVRELSSGHAAMMSVIIRSRRGVDDETAPAVLEDARRIAADYPDDPAVLGALAEAEYDAGNDAEAIAAADAALAIDSELTDAYVQKGFALFRKAEDSDDPSAAYAEALEPFDALRKVERDHPLPMIYAYRAFQRRGIEPDPAAVAGLERAAQLAPFDQGIQLTLARYYAHVGQIGLARNLLRPLTATTHQEGSARVARQMLDELESAQEGVRTEVGASSDSDDDEEEGGEARL